MGFYGNISNASRSSFQFDKTYANRFEMDQSCAIDEVYIGRYVLVDYNKDEDSLKTILPAYKLKI
jgi:hypothetical protein